MTETKDSSRGGPMKRFRSLALDREGRKYGGTFEAADEGEARRMLQDQGFRVLSLEEIACEEAEREEPADLRKKAGTRSKGKEAAEKKSSAKVVVDSGSPKTGNALWKTFGAAALVLGVLPPLLYLAAPKPPVNSPEEAARDFIEREIEGDFESQYAVLSLTHPDFGVSAAAYRKKRTAEQRSKKMLALSSEAQREENPDEAAARQVQIAGTHEIFRKRDEAQASVLTVREGAQEEYRVTLRLEDRYWRVSGAEQAKPQATQKDSAILGAGAQDASAADLGAVLPSGGFRGKTSSPGRDDLPEKKLLSPAESFKVMAAKQDALRLLEEAKAQGLIREEDYLIRKKQLE